jgi:hypothetical protein
MAANIWEARTSSNLKPGDAFESFLEYGEVVYLTWAD